MPDLDVQIQLRAEHIRKREFATIRRGYDPDQVREFLAAVGDSVQTLEDELRHAKGAAAPAPRTEAQAAQPRPATADSDGYEELGKRFAGLLGTADKEAQRLVAEAQAESTRILTEARTEADRIRVNAQERAEEARAESLAVLEKARVEAERTLTGLSSRREALLDQLQTMHTRLRSAADDLAAVIEKPETVTPPPAPARADTPAAKPATNGAAQAKAEPAPPARTPAPKAAPKSADAETLDPRYEDLWVSTDEGSVDIPDLASIELDFDEERPAT